MCILEIFIDVENVMFAKAKPMLQKMFVMHMSNDVMYIFEGHHSQCLMQY